MSLSAAQRGLFFAHQLAPDNPCYTTAELVEFDGPVDAARLARSVQAIYLESEQLRTTFRLTPDGPQQRVVERHTPALVEIDVCSEAAAQEWLESDLARSMDLLAGEVTRSALLRLPDGRAWWYHAAHHVVIDGYGAQQFLRRVAEFYANPVRTELVVPLAHVVAGQPNDPDADTFWDGHLSRMSGQTSLAGREAAPAPRALRRVVELDEDRQRSLTAGARRLGVGWPDLVLAAVGCYVARLAGHATARVGVPLMNRSLPGVGLLPSGRTVCTAMNVLPLTVTADGTLEESLAGVAAEQLALRTHPFLRQEDLTRRLRTTQPGAQLFGAQVNLIPFELELAFGATRAVVRNLSAGPVEDMTICLRGTPGRGRTVRLEIDANPHLYDADELALHLARLTDWLEVCAGAAPSAGVAALPLLTPDEHDRVIHHFNDTGVERESATLGRRFLDQVARTPDATALIFGGEHRTYADLHEAARRMAGGLAAAGIGPGDVVGVALPRGFALYEAVHAIALLGAVYLPLDPDLPPSRIEAMRADAAAAYVISEEQLPAASPNGTDPTGELDGPAYLLFTSGSTGRPKGVLVGHRAIDNRLAWMQHHLPLGPGDRVLHKTPISFDVSVWELFWPLQVGAAVVIASPGEHRDPRAIAELVRTQRVSTLHFVPSMLRAFLADPTSCARVAGGAVRHVVTSGEALTPDLVAGCDEVFAVRPTNLYGPTEAAVDVTVWDCTPQDRTVPIGRPIWNTACYVLDGAQHPRPIGAPGELWLGGVQLAEGYVGRPDLTQERFVDDPFRPGGRMYRTGDIASWRPDGALRYLGRDDDQVKVRGQRLELGEVETCLAGTPGTVGVAAGVVGVAAGVVEEQLVVWFVPADGVGAATAQATLRATAQARLPASFLPHHWVAVSAIPLGTSGKTDRARLAATAPPVAVVDATTGPRGLTEQRLCDVIARVLGLAQVGPDDDFFTIGGDSLRVLTLVGAIEDELGITMALADVFAAPTAAELAALVSSGVRRSHDTDELLTLRSGHPTRAPLFLLPPAGGLGWCYTGLLRELPVDLAVHTVQAPGLAHGSPEPVADLDALARRQLATIRTVVGDGPFHLAGWSLGGMAAQAVAALARAQGQTVGAVVLLDAYPSDQWAHLAEPTEADALMGLLRLGGVDAPPDTALDRQQTIDLLRAHGSAVGQLPEETLRGCVASVVEAARLVRSSRHRVLAGDLTVIVAAAPRAETWLDAAGWAPYVTGTVHTVAVAATHGELVRRPAVDEVGALLAEKLNKQLAEESVEPVAEQLVVQLT